MPESSTEVEPKPLSKRGQVGWITQAEIEWAVDLIDRCCPPQAMSIGERLVSKLLGIWPYATAVPDGPTLRIADYDTLVTDARERIERLNRECPRLAKDPA